MIGLMRRRMRMLDLIDRQEALRCVQTKRNRLDMMNAITELKKADATEHGFWFIITEIQGDNYEEKKMCSLCHARFPVMEMEFCPHCGAEMGGKT